MRRDPRRVDLDRRSHQKVPQLVLRGDDGPFRQQFRGEVDLLAIFDHRPGQTEPEQVIVERVLAGLPAHRQLDRLAENLLVGRQGHRRGRRQRPSHVGVVLERDEGEVECRAAVIWADTVPEMASVMLP